MTRTGKTLATRRVLTHLSALVACSVAILLSCGGPDAVGTVNTPVLTTVEIARASINLLVGQKDTVTAQAKDQTGKLLSRTFSWTSSDDRIATVTSLAIGGVITAVSIGTVSISATAEGKSSSATVTVSVAPVATVAVLPATITLEVGQTRVFTAEPRAAGGAALTGRAVTWSSSNPNVASVTGAGLVAALTQGTATISATSEGITGSAIVTVTLPPTRVSLGAWVPLGPDHIANGGPGKIAAGKLQAFALSGNNPAIMYTGGGLGSGNQGPFTQGGAFRSTDGGAHWSAISATLQDLTVNALWADPANANVVVAGTENAGILRSTDGGQSWSRIGSFTSATDFLVANGALIAATSSGIARSTDNGATWTVAAATTSPARVLASGGGAMIAGLDNGTILMQANSTAAWQTVRTTPNTFAWSVAIDPVLSSTAYALLGPHPVKMLKTTDGGATWAELPNPCFLPQTFFFNPVTRVLFLGCNSTMVSTTNGGQSWTTVPGAIWDTRRIHQGSNQASMIAGTDQGLYVTNDGGNTWTDLNSDVRSSILTSIAVRGSTILTAVQDYSPIVSFDGGTTWQHQHGNFSSSPPLGEDGQVLIHPTNPTYCYAYTVAGYQRSADGCRTFQLVAAAPAMMYAQPGGTDIIAVDQSTPSTIYVGAQAGVFRSTDFGATISATNWPMTQVTAIAVDPADGRIIYVGTTSKLFRSSDGGATWSERSIPLAGYPTTIAVNPRDPQNVIVGLAFGVARGGGVVRSTDRGNTFIAANSGLSTANVINQCCGVEVISVRFSAVGIAALATSTGAYVSPDGGAQWQNVTGGTAVRHFSDVAWDGNSLYVTTFGGGVLRATATVTPSLARKARK